MPNEPESMAEALLTSCEDTEPHRVHALGNGAICIGRGPIEEDIPTSIRYEAAKEVSVSLEIQRNYARLASPKFDVDLLYRQLGLTREEAEVARRGSSIQAHYEGQLGTDR